MVSQLRLVFNCQSILRIPEQRKEREKDECSLFIVRCLGRPPEGSITSGALTLPSLSLTEALAPWVKLPAPSLLSPPCIPNVPPTPFATPSTLGAAHRSLSVTSTLDGLARFLVQAAGTVKDVWAVFRDTHTSLPEDCRHPRMCVRLGNILPAPSVCVHGSSESLKWG